jgi:hypothetical protein
MRQKPLPLATVLVLGMSACALPPIATPTPPPSPTPSPSPTPTPPPTPTPTPTPSPTPDAGALPDFVAGDVVTTTIDGLRVRQRPGLSSAVVAGLLPHGAELGVVMGPVVVEGQGWYLVTDADPDDPSFEEGWIASGFEPEAFLASAGRVVDDSPYIGSYAQTGNAEFGPIEIPDDPVAIRWVALDPEGVRCQFDVLLEPSSGEPVRAIRATVGNDVVPGTLQPSFLASQPTLRGPVFLSVASDCAWTLVVTRVPEPVPPPTASP